MKIFMIPALFSCLVSMLVAPGARATGIAPQFLFNFGSPGSGPGQFGNSNPIAIVVGDQGDVYVTDRANCRIEHFNTQGTFLNMWGTCGSGPGQFSLPKGLALDAQGNVYVADQGNSRIQVFSPAGNFLRSWGTPGNGPGQLNGPKDVAVDPSGFVYVSNSATYVSKFTSDGTYVTRWGGVIPPQLGPCAAGTFATIEGLAADRQGNLYVTDDQSFAGAQVCERIQKFHTDGQFVTEWHGVDYPKGLGVAGDFVYLAETGPCCSDNARVKAFSNTGALLVSWGGRGAGDGKFATTDVAVDKNGFVYVADAQNSRIVVFGPSATAAASKTWGALRRIYR